jgi:D-alanine-D-alanine ligase
LINFMNLTVLLGGTSAEREISLHTGAAMAKAYAALGHTVTLLYPATGRTMGLDEFRIEPPHAIPPTPEELAGLSQGSVFVDSLTSDAVKNADAVVIGLHGVPGEDGTVQAILELLGKKFTGSGSRSSAISIDKAYTKILMAAAGVPTPKWSFISKGTTPEQLEFFAQRIPEVVGEKIVIKPNDQGSTVGLTISTQADFDFRSAVDLAWKYSDGALIEEFIDGKEYTVGILAGRVLPIVEIAPEGGFYDYHHKYTKGMTNYYCPADVSERLESLMSESAMQLFNACGCKGYARVDFRVDAEGRYYCLEINTLPGMTETSLVPKAAKAAGLSFEELCKLILESSIA